MCVCVCVCACECAEVQSSQEVILDQPFVAGSPAPQQMVQTLMGFDCPPQSLTAPNTKEILG